MTTSINAFLLNTPYNLGAITPRGVWNATTNYATGDSVSYSTGSGVDEHGNALIVTSSYVAIQNNINKAPTDTAYWQVLALGVANPAAIMTTKGDILTRDNIGLNILHAGNNGEALLVDSTNSTGNRFFPAQINVQKMTVGGTSYMDNTQGDTIVTDNGLEYSLDQNLFSRVCSVFDIEPGKVINLARSGSLLTYDQYQSAGGGWQTVLQSTIIANASSNNLHPPIVSPNGLCVGVWGINDVGRQSLNTVAAGIQMYKHSLRTVISRWRSGAVYESQDATIQFSGSYTHVDNRYINSGTGYTKLTALNSKATITTQGPNTQTFSPGYEGGTIALGFVGTSLNAGGVVSIRLDGSPVASINGVTGSTFSTHPVETEGNRYGMVARIAVPAGQHTIQVNVDSLGSGVSPNITTTTNSYVVTVNSGGVGLAVGQAITGTGIPANSIITGVTRTSTIVTAITLNQPATASGTVVASVLPSVDFDYWQIETNYPNPIIIANIAKVDLPANNPNGFIGDYNSAISGVVAEFPSPIAVADIQELLYNPYGNQPYRLEVPYGLHPTAVGAQYICEAIRVAYLRSGATLHDTITPNAWNMGNSAPGEALAPIWASTRSQGFISQRGLSNSTSNMTLPKGFIYFVPIMISQPCTFDQFILENVTSAAGAGAVCHVGIYADLKGFPNARISDFGAITITSTGTQTITLSTPLVIQTPGLYWLAINPYSTNTGADVAVSAVTGGDKRVPAISSRNPSSLAYGLMAFGLFPQNGLPVNRLDAAYTNKLFGTPLDVWSTNDLSPIMYLRAARVAL